MPQPISPKPKTRFKYFREVRAGWLVAGLAGLAFTLAYPSVIEPRLNSDDSGDVPATAPANQQQQESGWDKQLHRNTPNPKKPQQGSDDQNLPRDVSGSSGSTGGGISPNRERTPNQGGPFGSGSGSGSGTGTGTGSGSGSGSGAGTGTGTGTGSGSGSGSGAFGSGSGSGSSSDEGHGMGGVFGNR